MEIVSYAEERKALNAVVLDLRKISNFCDFFVILTGTAKTHIQAIADGITGGLLKHGLHKSHREGYHEAKWLVLDYVSIIVHIFDEETRDFYDLEHLWSDAPHVLKKPRKREKHV